jgi:uncharacterized protein (TIGR02271 family)
LISGEGARPSRGRRLNTKGRRDKRVERVPAAEGDSGEVETLPDGSISVPVLEEELVVTKRVVVRERVIVRKRTTTERRRIEAELRKERVDLMTADDESS